MAADLSVWTQYVLHSILMFVAMVPAAVFPVLTWTVYGAVATSLYSLWRPGTLDYVLAPIALAYIAVEAFRRDRWAGLAGLAAGAAYGMIASDFARMIVWDALYAFFVFLVQLFIAVENYLWAWGLILFMMGVQAGYLLLISIFLAFGAGLFTGFLLSGLSAYVSYLTGTARLLLHGLARRLPPGAMALAALPVAAFTAATEVLAAMVTLYLAFMLTFGFFIGVFIGTITLLVGFFFFFFGFFFALLFLGKPATDVGAYIVGILISKFWHRLEHPVLSPAVLLAVILAYATKVASPALLMVASYALLLSRRRGHEAYTWIATALTAHVALTILYLMPAVWYWLPVVAPRVPPAR